MTEDGFAELVDLLQRWRNGFGTINDVRTAVAAYVEQQARERAAVELEAAADRGTYRHNIREVVEGWQLRHRAAALRGQA